MPSDTYEARTIVSIPTRNSLFGMSYTNRDYLLIVVQRKNCDRAVKVQNV
jgi:hypothetical protein